MTRLFDVYIAVDWSASSVPGPATPRPDTIWVGERLASDGHGDDSAETYWRTRRACAGYLRERLVHHAERERRVFIGFDFGYGYPHGLARALGVGEDLPGWRLMWNELTRRIVDDEANANNRFEVAAALNARCGSATPGPFWGCPVGRERATLERTSPVSGYPYPVRPGLALDRLRWTERRQRGVQPMWKLAGAGSVGGQALVGIPVVCRLRDDPALAAFSQVWPFETGFTPRPTPMEGPFILHVEIWPGIVPAPLDPNIAIRDQAQVRGMARWLAQLDADGALGALFDQPRDLSAEAEAACVGDEGWIIGVR